MSNIHHDLPDGRAGPPSATVMRRAGSGARQNRRLETHLSLRAISVFPLFLTCVSAIIFPSTHELYSFDYLSSHSTSHSTTPATSNVLTKRDKPIPLVVTNSCPDILWPGVSTGIGEGPDNDGFQLDPGETRELSVGPTWQGRVWGRTNCTVSGDSATCDTGDCNGKLSCAYGGSADSTLAEFNLAGGVSGQQTFYDISLVDGYNLPLAIVYKPAPNTSWIPPNLVNPSCIATTGYLGAPETMGYHYTNESFPIPYETKQTNEAITDWCPWDLQVFPPEKPGDGIYPYPDDNIERPVFDPCQSACTAYGLAKDCCTGKYHDPSICGPSQYSKRAKSACPDAYSFAFDDQTSTFIIPSGGGFEVVFCPQGRSTNILATFYDELHEIASAGLGTGGNGSVSPQTLLNVMSPSYIEAQSSAAATRSGIEMVMTFGIIVMAFFTVTFVGS